MEKEATAAEIGGLLFGIHEHHGKTGKIIYYEKDIIKLLVKLGHPKPVWGISIELDKFKTKKPQKLAKIK